MRANISTTREKKLPTAPILEIIKTRGFWAFLFALLGSMWGNFTMWTSIPLYLNNIQHFSLKTVRIMSELCEIFDHKDLIKVDLIYDLIEYFTSLSLKAVRIMSELCDINNIDL